MKTNTQKSQTNNTQQSPIFITAYGPKMVVQTQITGADRTRQAHKDECDINKIMAKAMLNNGVVDFVNKHQGQFGDATGRDFDDAMKTIADSRSMFLDLPASIRSRFENNPGKFLDFVHDPANRSEMADMGLLRPDYVPTSTPAAVAATAASAKPQADSPPGDKPAKAEKSA